MNDLTKTLMKRDGLDEKAAKKEVANIRSEAWSILDNGYDYDEIEEMLMDDYGLEMDYIMDLF